MDQKLQDAATTADREIVLEREINAPRSRVFDAWTDPVKISKWFGPDGFTTTTIEMVVKPGGAWRYIMHGPDGADYNNRIDYHRIVRPERLDYLQSGDEGEVQFHVTVTFTEQNSKSKVTMRMLFDSVADRDVCVEAGIIEGGRQTLRRLAESLGG